MTAFMRTTFRAGCWAVLCGLAALLAAAVLVPRLAGASVYTVLSGSMEPGIDPGSLVVARPTDPDKIGVGSIITFQLKSGDPTVVTHRVVKQGVDKHDQPVFLTEGDANSTPDQIWVQPEQIRGTLWYEIPYVGYASTLIPFGVREALVAATGLALLGYGALAFLTTARERWRLRDA